MQSKRYRVVLLVILVVLVVLFTGVVGRPLRRRYRAQRSATRFYNSLIEGHYPLAFEHLAYYDRYADVAPDLPPAVAEELWTERVKALREEGVYLAEVNDLEIRLDDGYPIGAAEVTIVDQGIVVTAVQRIHFVARAGEWKIQNVSLLPGTHPTIVSKLNRALSGLIPHPDEEANENTP